MKPYSSPRQELLAFVGTGRLRESAEKARLTEAATELLIRVVFRYCEVRKNRK